MDVGGRDTVWGVWEWGYSMDVGGRDTVWGVWE